MKLLAALAVAVVLLFATLSTSQASGSTYGSLQWDMRAIQVTKAYHYATTQGKGVTVCNVDTGASLSTPDLAAAIIGDTNTVTPASTSYNDDQGHGTHTAVIEVGRGVNITG